MKRDKLQEMGRHRSENVDLQQLKQNQFLEICPNQPSQFTGWLKSRMHNAFRAAEVDFLSYFYQQDGTTRYSATQLKDKILV